MISQKISVYILLLVLVLCFATLAYSVETTEPDEGVTEETTIEQSISRNPEITKSAATGSIGQYVYEFTQALASGSTIGTIDAIEALWGHSGSLSTEVQRTLDTLKQNSTGDMSLRTTLIILLGIFPIAFGLEKLTRYLFSRYLLGNKKEKNDGDSDSPTRFLSALISQTVSVLLYSLYCLFLFNLAHGDDATITMKAIFLSALSMLVLGRVISFVMEAYLKTETGLTESGRKQILHGFLFIVWVNCFTLFTTICFRHLGVSRENIELFAIGSLTLNQLIITFVFIYYRKDIRSFLNRYFKCDTGDARLSCRVINIWFIPFLVYLVVIWGLQIQSIYYQTDTGKGAYFISILAVPLYFLLIRTGCWIVTTSIKGLNLYKTDQEEEEKNCRIKEDMLITRLCNYVHPVMFSGLAIWVLTKWGYEIPYISERAGAVLNITLTVGMTLLAWHIITGIIENKLKSTEDDDREDEDEWGVAGNQGREHTLLPVLRKCVGVILALIAGLACLSSLGVNIGPLLAGAGVIGIAIGFGSQKVVSDILSGFFFLMDDSFRVGEYIEAGTVKGRVEEITLRNVLLRHHRGMLQVVPFSELGAVTNYMRGGIVEKFNLEFPYDTDVDKVRKIVKKVGLAMLDDEEFGDDFIRPLKSQGVSEISNSVMVIRAKFTAKPGKHFVIRREAYRRVTEALNAKGVYYAHRKVIVDLPGNSEDPGKLLEKAGAAVMDVEQNYRTNKENWSS